MALLMNYFEGSWLFHSWPVSILLILAASICACIALGIVAVIGLGSNWLERKVSAHMQCRLGPMLVGWHGLLQPIADGIKFFIKEDIIPAMADRRLFVIAPVVVFTGALLAWMVVPLGPRWVAADLNIGLLFLLATSPIVVIGIIMAGWASHNKWSLYGTMRSAAQFLSYEVPTALHLLPPVLLAGSLNLRAIVEQQSGGFLGMGHWYIWNPFCLIAFVAYYVSSLAETGRIPFDLPESESELVAGYHTEYSGMRLTFFFMADYADLFMVSAVSSLLFFGGWHGPFGIHHPLIYIMKMMLFVLVAMWLRWTLPRLRIDQLMATCWKFLIPLGLVNILGASFWMYLTGQVK